MLVVIPSHHFSNLSLNLSVTMSVVMSVSKSFIIASNWDNNLNPVSAGASNLYQTPYSIIPSPVKIPFPSA